MQLIGISETHCVRDNDTGYEYSQLGLQLPDHDVDLDLKFPDGRVVVLQWRVEYQTIDLCFSEDDMRHIYTGDGIAPGEQEKDGSIIGNQIIIC